MAYGGGTDAIGEGIFNAGSSLIVERVKG